MPEVERAQGMSKEIISLTTVPNDEKDRARKVDASKFDSLMAKGKKFEDQKKYEDALAQQNWQTQWDYQLEQDALARQDALNKLLSGSGGDYSSKPSSGGILETIYGMTDEAQVYDYLVSNGYSNAEVQGYMNYWAQNRQLAAGPEAPSGNYSAIVELMQEMQGEDAKISEVRQMLEEAYRDGMITETEYRKLLNQSR